MMLKHVDIYVTHTVKGFVADSARYAYALMYHGIPRYGYGQTDERTTQNRIVLVSMREALARMRHPCEITFHIDSQYITRAFANGWTEAWKRSGYEKAGGGKIVDSAGWEALLTACSAHVVKAEYSVRHEMAGILEAGIRRGGIFEQ